MSHEHKSRPCAFGQLRRRNRVSAARPSSHHSGRRHGAQLSRSIEVSGEDIHQSFAAERKLRIQNVERSDSNEIFVVRERASPHASYRQSASGGENDRAGTRSRHNTAVPSYATTQSPIRRVLER